jgi:hypothetical protein
LGKPFPEESAEFRLPFLAVSANAEVFRQVYAGSYVPRLPVHQFLTGVYKEKANKNHAADGQTGALLWDKTALHAAPDHLRLHAGICRRAPLQRDDTAGFPITPQAVLTRRFDVIVLLGTINAAEI